MPTEKRPIFLRCYVSSIRFLSRMASKNPGFRSGAHWHIRVTYIPLRLPQFRMSSKLWRARQSGHPGTYFQFPAWVEICRHRKGVAVPSDLQVDYFEALSRMPALVAAASVRAWDDGLLVCALAAIAAAKGYPAVAEAALELTGEVPTEFMTWFLQR